MDLIAQLMIAVLGIMAVYLSQDRRYKYRKWACIFGLAGEPFWLYAAISAQQWGIIVLCFVYALGWLRGVRNYWWIGGQDDTDKSN